MAFRGAASRRRLLQRGRWVASPSLTHDQASSMIHFAPPSTEPVEAAKSSKDDPWHPTTMQASIIPTRHFQRSLPRLPIPSLSSTLNKMMQHATPLLAPAQLAQLRQSIDVFAEREGKTLQEELTKTDRANQHTSFISSDWFEMMLRDRSPLGLHNYRTIVCRQPSATAPLPTGVDDSIYRAACWIVSSVRWYQLYLNNELPPLVAYTSSSKHDADNYYHKDWFGRTVALCPTYVSAPLMTIASGYHAFPQDISTSDSLFNTTRVPGILQDELKAVGFHAHIAVQYRGHQFVVTVADDDCNPLPIGQIYARLHQIVSSNVAPSTHDVAALTGLPRSEWSALRTSLLRHTTNQQSLELVDSSMFVLNLEESAKKADASHVIPHSADDCLPQHCSPWLDKSLSIHITGHGGVAVGSESSWGGDDVVQRYADDVARDAYGCTDSARRTAWSTVAASEPLRHLSWTWTDAAKEALANTQRRLAQRRGERSSASTLISFRPSASCTSPPAVNPESMIALAMPLAWWRMQQRVGSVVERISMSTFNRGRVDGVRAVSEASQRFVFAAAGGAKNTELPQMCRDAISIYEREKQDVLLGRGMEAHVLAWKMVSERLFGRQPSILNHPSYSALRRVDMELCLLGRGRRASSPSGLLYQVATPRDDEGVGVHVARVHPDHPDYVLSVAANTASGVSAPDFGAAIVEALNDLECILQTEA